MKTTYLIVLQIAFINERLELAINLYRIYEVNPVNIDNVNKQKIDEHIMHRLFFYELII